MSETGQVSYPPEHLMLLNRAGNQTFFLRGFGHAFRNPINSILLASELLQGYIEEINAQLSECDDDGCSIPEELLETGGRHLASMSQIIRDISISGARLNQFVACLTEVTSRGAVDNCSEVNLARLAALCPQVLQLQIREYTDNFSLDLEDDLPQLPGGNAQQLLQVMLNLLINALLALPERSCKVQFSLSGSQSAGYVQICVKDHGCGIPPELLPRIAEPFFTTWQHLGCQGLGLAVATQIVKKHGGSLAITSEVGKGTEVTARLPLA